MIEERIRRPAGIRIVYFGTPEYAVPALRALAADSRCDVRLVVTQPARPAGRGHSLQQPAVKRAALELDLPVYQPQSLRLPEQRQPLVDAEADLFVVAAYGIIFGPKTLSIPRFGCVNLHASLLPKYRGASPISASILAGDCETGVTLMKMDAGMDTGGIIAARSVAIERTDTTGSLTDRLAIVGAELLMETLESWVSGEIVATPQPLVGASQVRPMTKADGWIDWNRTAVDLERQSRAMRPWPTCWTTLPGGNSMQVVTVNVNDEATLEPGHVSIDGKRVLVGCGSGGVELDRVQVAGSQEGDAITLINGRKLKSGDVLGLIGRPDLASPLISPAGD